MKIFNLLFITLAAITFFSVVEARSLTERYPSLYDNEWEKKVKLTQYQMDKIKIIRDANQEKMNVLLMEMDTIRHEMAALIEENEEQVRSVLSEKQKVKYDMYQYQQKKKRNDHKGEEKPSRKKMRVY